MMGGLIRTGLKRAFSPVSLVGMAVIAALVGFGQPAAHALPGASTDVLYARGQVTISSRLGAEMVTLNGTVTVQHGDPFVDMGVDVIDTEIIAMNLAGTSVVGNLVVLESSTLDSTGEVRSLQPSPPEYPASSFFDVFSVVTVPADPLPTVQLTNTTALHMTPGANVTEWPPVQLTYTSQELWSFDNDGDTLIDEDSADDDGDHMWDEDPPGGGNQDTDAQFDEDGPVGANNDGDGQVDEDDTCVPLFPSLPVGACVVSISLTLYGDTDKDGCTDAAEVQTGNGSQGSGGLRDPDYFWDFLDVPTGSTLLRDRAVSGADIGAIVARFGSTDTGAGPFNRNSDPLTTPNQATLPPGNRQNYHPSYDRGGSQLGGDPWDMLPADGAVSGGDVAGAVLQFGHSCVSPPA
jgi:hypothetical protein